MEWAGVHPVAAADEGTPPGPLTRVSTLNFRLCLVAAVFLLALLLPRLLPSSHAPRHRPITVAGVMKIDPALSISTASSRPRDASPTARVLILPGLGAGAFSFRDVYRSLASRGLLAVAIDLPGQGLSPKLASSFFRALVRLVRTGDSRAPSPYEPAQAAAAVARAVEALGVAPVHLVIHDSALAAGAAFVSANPWAVRSVTLIDSAATLLPAFPAAVFNVPVAGKLVLWVPPLFRLLLRLCCVRGVGLAMAAYEHRAVMMERGTEGVVEAWKAMNRSFEQGEWRRSSAEVMDLPMMVLWSRTWSDWWIKEGNKVAAALPDAKFLYHSGSRWPQVDAPEEISERITEFVTSFEKAAGDYFQRPVTLKEHYSQLETSTRSVSINPGEIFYGGFK